MTDTDGNLLGRVTQSADIQDRDGAPRVIAQALESHPTLAHIFAPLGECSIHLPAKDGGYAGDKLRDAMTETNGPTIEIVRRPPGVTGFVVIARRWVVERTFAWLGPLSAMQGIACRAVDAAASRRTGSVQSHPQTQGH